MFGKPDKIKTNSCIKIQSKKSGFFVWITPEKAIPSHKPFVEGSTPSLATEGLRNESFFVLKKTPDHCDPAFLHSIIENHLLSMWSRRV